MYLSASSATTEAPHSSYLCARLSAVFCHRARAAQLAACVAIAWASDVAGYSLSVIRQSFPTIVSETSASTASISPGAEFQWKRLPPAERGMDAARLTAMKEELARRGTKALLVIRDDAILLEWYAPGHSAKAQHYTASLAKSLGGMSLIVAMNDGLIRPDDPAHRFIPEWRDDPVRRKITVRQLATYSAGIEDASSPDGSKSLNDLDGWKGEFWRGRSLGRGGSVWAERNPFTISLREAPIVFEPGTDFGYSNPGMAVLALAVTAAIEGTRHEDVRTLLRERIMRPIGVEDGDWSIGYGRTYMVYGLPVVKWGGGGITARALARVGRLLLRKGDWEGEQLIAPRWVELALRHGGTPLPERSPNNPYPTPAMVWYNNEHGAWKGVPRDAFAGAGAGNQHLMVIPSLELIVVRNGATIEQESRGEALWGGAYRYLIRPVVAAVTDRAAVESEKL